VTNPARVAVITVSDSRVRGAGDDASGDAIAERMATLPATVVHRACVPDDIESVQDAVRTALDAADVVVLTGGTGLGPRDVTPQALAPMLDYQVPGMAEAMRVEGLRHTPHAMLSRQVVGVARGALVVALPGNPRAVGECLDAIWASLPHALALLRGDTAHKPPV